jgi:hypothetical protein
LNIRLGKNFKLSIPITHSLNAESESIPDQDPIEEVKVVSLDDLIEPNLKDDVQFFIEEEDENPIDLEPLDKLLESHKPTIEGRRCQGGAPPVWEGGSQDVGGGC